VKNPRLYRKGLPRPIQYLKDLYALKQLQSDSMLWRCLSPVFEKSHSTGCDYSELLMLYKHVRNERPSTILELGSGVSTAVIAYAIHSLSSTGYRCRLISMEEDKRYHAQIVAIFPEVLRPYVEIIQSPTEDREVQAGLFSRCYINKPRLKYDFVFIDGPQVPRSDEYFDGDILDVLEWNSSPIVAFLDQRIKTRRALRRLMPFARIKANREFAVFHIPEAAKRSAL